MPCLQHKSNSNTLGAGLCERAERKTNKTTLLRSLFTFTYRLCEVPAHTSTCKCTPLRAMAHAIWCSRGTPNRASIQNTCLQKTNWKHAQIHSQRCKHAPYTHLTRSYARTVPSRLALTRACPEGKNATAVTGAVCSAKVTKQKPLDSWNSLTCTAFWSRCV